MKNVKTNLDKYGTFVVLGFRHAYYLIGGIYLDSKYGFYFYVYCRDYYICYLTLRKRS